MIKTRTWIIVILAAAVILSGLSYAALNKKAEGSVVQIIQNGDILQEIDLSRVAQEYSFTVEYPEGGSNVITVRPGAVRVSEADCPDHICVEQGWLTDQAAPIVCMPHRLMIRLNDSASADAVSQ